jgi:hypothetical protein
VGVVGGAADSESAADEAIEMESTYVWIGEFAGSIGGAAAVMF